MTIQFATCERRRALEFIQKVYPGRNIEDTPESISTLLDLVEKDIIRIQDPNMYGKRIGVVPGRNWTEDDELRTAVVAACKLLTG